MPRFSCYENNLAAMMGFMGHEVGHEVYYIRGDVGPREIHSKLPTVIQS